MIRIGLHRGGRSLIGTLIRWQTRGEYSHASVLLQASDGIFHVIESIEGVGVRWLSGGTGNPYDYLKKNAFVDLFEVAGISEEQESVIRKFLFDQLEKPYDYTMVARFVSRRPETARTKGKWFCSELVYAAFQEAGIDLFRDTQAWEVSPALLGRSPLLNGPVKTITGREDEIG